MNTPSLRQRSTPPHPRWLALPLELSLARRKELGWTVSGRTHGGVALGKGCTGRETGVGPLDRSLQDTLVNEGKRPGLILGPGICGGLSVPTPRPTFQALGPDGPVGRHNTNSVSLWCGMDLDTSRMVKGPFQFQWEVGGGPSPSVLEEGGSQCTPCTWRYKTRDKVFQAPASAIQRGQSVFPSRGRVKPVLTDAPPWVPHPGHILGCC